MINPEIRKVGVISLGCAKNKVDCEIMLKKIVDEGYELCDRFDECDAIVINTCAFIKEAKEEALDNIFEAVKYKGSSLKRLIVTGCLAQRYAEEIKQLIPEVDAIVGVKSFDKICDVLASNDSQIVVSAPLTSKHPEGDRLLTTESFSVYLKIAEGCSNRCAYCAIPYIRGPYMPRNKNHILAEAKTLAENGAVEINLIAQDLTRHPDLIWIIKKIAEIKSVRWIRLLYLYPDEITPELITLIKEEKKVVKYIDLPLQHSSYPILRRMNRRGTATQYKKLIRNMRVNIPDMAVRTTFIVGFPGERLKDFNRLIDFVNEVKFDNMGAFIYSPEENTPAVSFDGQVSKRTKQRRLDKLMTVQYNIVQNRAKQYIGKTEEVLCEGMDENGNYIGRTQFQAPEVDGNVFFSSDTQCEPGKFYNVKIEKIDNYDLYGRTVK